VSYLVDKMS